MDINQILNAINDVVWGIPLIVLVVGAGLLLTIRLGGIQVKHLGKALKFMVKEEEGAKGEVSSFGAFCTAMSATVGTGNIVGVAGAVVIGGPGALFWMILVALLGMVTKYAEGLLAVKYRTIAEDGHAIGGPFYYIEKGMGKQWKPLAVFFAIFGIGAGLLGIGTMTQVNSIASAVKGFFDPNGQHIAFSIGDTAYSWATVAAALIVALVVGLVVIGGIKRIANVSSVVVPFMAILYILICTAILVFNVKAIPGAVVTIVESAFGVNAVAGGAFGAIMLALQKGVERGVFSNEAGLGSAAIAAAAAKTNEPARQGLVQMCGVFIDTIIICLMTGLAVVITGAHEVAGLEGANITGYAFANGLPWNPEIGSFILMIVLAFFAFTTILGWDYYSEKCLEYLTNGNMKVVKAYKYLYIIAVLIGPFVTVQAVWTIASIMNGLMAIPNLIAVVALSGVVVKESKDYFARLNQERLK